MAAVYQQHLTTSTVTYTWNTKDDVVDDVTWKYNVSAEMSADVSSSKRKDDDYG